MAGNFVDSILIGVGLDASQIATGIQQVGAQLDSGLSAAAQNAAAKMSPLGEALKGLSTQAEQFKKPIQEDIKALDKLERELGTELPASARQGFAGAEAAAGKFKGFISSVWAQISGPLLGAFAVGGTISSYMSNATAAGELAEKLKVDIEEIQIWSGAMERAGGSASSLQATIEKLNASGKAQGDAIGVLLDLADKATTMSKEAFVAKAKELEIDEKTIDVLAQGRKALDEHLKRQQELGVYTKEDAENSKKFKQALSDLLKAWDSLTSFIGSFAVPIMEDVAKIFTDIVVYLRKHPALIAAAIALVGGALTAKLLPPLKALPAIIANVSKAFMRWFPFVAVIMALALVIEDFWVYLHGGKSALEDVWKVFGTGPELLAKFKAAWAGLKGAIKAVWVDIKQLARYFAEVAKTSGWLDGLKNALKGVAQIFKGLFSGNIGDVGKGLGKLVRGLGQMVIGAFKSLGTIVKDLFKNLFNFEGGDISISGVMDAIWNAVTGTFDFLWEFIKSFWEGVFDIELPSLDELGTKIWNTVKQVFDNLKKMVTDFFKNMFKDFKLPSIKDLLGGAGDVAGGAVDLVKGGLGKVGDFFGDMFKDAEPETAKAGAKVEDGMAKTAGTVQQGFNAAWSATRDFAVTQFQGAASTIQQIFAGIVSGIETQVGNLVLGAQRMAQPGMIPAAAGVRAQNAGRGGNVTVNQQNRINVDARGGDPAKVQRGVERGINPGRTARAAASGTVQK